MARGFGVDTAALSAYGSTATGLADEVGAVGTATLAGTTSLAAGSFGAIGDEVGLGAAFQRAAQAQVDGAAAASAALSAFAGEVGRTAQAYVEQEAANSAALDRASRA
ncbi:type VII secretion target [Actinosynnema sp. NPDC059335]|uniref:type VII secretion target n=1 Tax=Actinosynnema sp. NPDC059335 TaxID=3346804 RepID=UPI00366B3C8F